MYVKADYFYGALVKKREIPELPAPTALLNSVDMGEFQGKVTQKCPIWVNKEVQAIFVDTNLHLQISMQFALHTPHAIL